MSKKRLVVNGLVSNLSKTSAVGGMAEAQNLVSRAADKLESRHGTALVSKSASQIRKLFTSRRSGRTRLRSSISTGR
jgi:hypothetical protein